MTIKHLTLAALAGAALGALAVHGLQAQSRPPAYAVIDIAEITDAAAYAAIGPRGGPSIEAFGGRFLARTSSIVPSDGVAPQRYALIAFESLDKAKAWRASPAMREIWAIQEKSSRSRIFFVEGPTP